uniref:Uncharacterized protein n=1 Tax=Anopheles coluzzii TaxID=1518534 RepID=A0A8W7PSA4_ANOCL
MKITVYDRAGMSRCRVGSDSCTEMARSYMTELARQYWHCAETNVQRVDHLHERIEPDRTIRERLRMEGPQIGEVLLVDRFRNFPPGFEDQQYQRHKAEQEGSCAPHVRRTLAKKLAERYFEQYHREAD